MLLLTTTSDKIQLGINPAITLDIHASFMDSNGSLVTPGRQNTETTIETTKDIVASPGASVKRSVKTLHVHNTHATDPSEISVLHNDGSTTVELRKVTLEAGWKLSYVDGQGFRVFDADGIVR